MRSALPAVLLACFASTAAAQQAARPDPADPNARSARPNYQSAFAAYRHYVEPQLAPWRDANDQVRDLGGHAGHLAREGAAEKPTAKPPAHAGHGDRK